MTAKHAFLGAFDRLFDRAAAKLELDSAANDRDEARKQFSERFDGLLRALDEVPLEAVPESTIAEIETAVDQLSRRDLASLLISIPLAQHGQAVLRQVAGRAAEQRMLDHVLSQADDSFGGN